MENGVTWQSLTQPMWVVVGWFPRSWECSGRWVNPDRHFQDISLEWHQPESITESTGSTGSNTQLWPALPPVSVTTPLHQHTYLKSFVNNVFQESNFHYFSIISIIFQSEIYNAPTSDKKNNLQFLAAGAYLV